MTIRHSALVLIAAAGLFAAAAHAEPPPQAKDGKYVNAAGMTVYTFTKDQAGSGKSVCHDDCAKHWPPVMADGDAKPKGDWTVITRDNGGKQRAYKGWPLYTYAKDMKPGDAMGDKFKDMWNVAKP